MSLRLGRAVHPSSIILALLGAFAAVPSPAALESFTPLGPPQGCLQSLVVDSAGRRLVAMSVTGVTASADRGASWSGTGGGLSHDPPRVLALGRAPGEVFAASATALYRSTDGGRSWQRSGSLPFEGDELFGSDLLVFSAGSATSPGTLYLARGRRLLQSRDGGVQFHLVLSTPTDILALEVDPLRPARVFVGIAGASLSEPAPAETFYASADAGRSWRARHLGSDPASSGAVEQLSFDRTTGTLFAIVGSRLFRSGDLGHSWRFIVPREGQSAIAEGFSYRVLLDPRRPGTVYLVHQSDNDVAVLVSGNLGDTWRRLQRGSSLASAEQLFLIDEGRRILARTDQTLVELDLANGALHPVPLGPQISCHGNEPFMKVRFLPADPATVFVNASGALWTSRDRGLNWARSQVIGDYVFDVATRAGRPQEIVAATDQGLAISTNGGRSFHRLSRELPELWQLLRLEDGSLLAGADGVFRSTDGGVSLERTLPDLPRDGDDDRAILSLHEDPRRPATVYAHALDGFGRHGRYYERPIFRSVDGGARWQRLTQEGYALTLDRHVGSASRGSRLYLWTLSGLEESFDGGQTWQLLGPADGCTANDLLVDPRAAGLLWVACEDGVRRSVDGGWTFAPVPGTEGLRVIRLFAQDAVRGRIWAVTDQGLKVGRFSLP